MTDGKDLLKMLAWRGLTTENACPGCSGSGTKVYSGTATFWHKGIQGRIMTRDLCDQCWGTGNKHQPGLDPRAVSMGQEEREALLASCGWLAEVVINNQGGTPDPTGWIRRGKTFYREAQERSRNYEAMLKRMADKLQDYDEAGLVTLGDAASDILARKGIGLPSMQQEA